MSATNLAERLHPADLESAHSPRPLLHPLAGIGLRRLTKLLIERGGVSRRYAHQIALIYLGGIARKPFTAAERLRVARQVDRRPPTAAPVFIVGHWRSGTTFLHNVLSCDPQFCFPTVLDALRPSEFLPSPFDFISRGLLSRSLPRTRPMDDVPLSLHLPQEEELALATMGSLSFFNCFYFPRDMSRIFAESVLMQGISREKFQQWQQDFCYYLAKLSILHSGRQLLLKNPANSARISQLSTMFPGARFIHVHRNPADVLPSTRKLYRKMLGMVALQPYDMEAVERHIEWSYPALMEVLLAGLDELPVEQRVDVAYDDLVRDPPSVVQGIYNTFGFSGFGSSRKAMQSSVPSMRHAASTLDDGDAAFGERMQMVIQEYQRRLGYVPPSGRWEKVAC